MTRQTTFNWRDPLQAAWLVLGAFLLVNIVLTVFKLFNKTINPDELQHLHIGWIIAQGDIIYRDFWEHHGPVYGLLNGALIYLTNADASLNILFWSRAFSLGCTALALYFTWQIARLLQLSRLEAFIAIVASSALVVMQTKGLEMRPDPLQSMCWIAGLYYVIRNQSERTLRLAIYAGALFTLSILSNAKAGVGPFFIVVYYLLGRWIAGLEWADIFRDLFGMFMGLVLCALPFSVYFLWHGAFIDFLYYNFLWNLEVIFYWSATELQFAEGLLKEKSVGLQNFELFLFKQTPFLVLGIVGAVMWLGRLGAKQDVVNRQRNWLFIFATLGTTLGWLLDLYTQFFLMFLPLWAILVSVSISTIVKSVNNSLGHRNAIIVGSLIAVLTMGGMLKYSLEKASFRTSEQLTRQKDFTNQFVSLTERDEPVGIIWSLCGGYMFNDHVGYYWAALADISEIISTMTGEHPHGQNFIDEMEDRQVNYVIGMETWLTGGMSDEAMDYLRENFDYSYCLWTRKGYEPEAGP